MKTFTFILSSPDHRALDTSLGRLCQELAHPETHLTMSTLPADTTGDERVFKRRLHIASEDFHVMDKLQKVDLVHSVAIHGIAQ